MKLSTDEKFEAVKKNIKKASDWNLPANRLYKKWAIAAKKQIAKQRAQAATAGK